MSLPTLDEFLTWTYPKNSYVDHPDFHSLYLRISDAIITLDGGMFRCERVVQIANIEAHVTGKGAFRRLVADLAQRGYAILVENAHSPRFFAGLPRMGFVPINVGTGPHFLTNYEGHLTPISLHGICADKV